MLALRSSHSGSSTEEGPQPIQQVWIKPVDQEIVPVRHCCAP
jgi:hypothetical protein